MVSFADVRRWKPDGLDSVHAELGKRRDNLIDLQDELDGAKNPGGWSGEAADASAKRHRELVENMRALIAEVATVRVAVGTAADDVAKIKQQIEQADHEARANGFEITEEGGVKDVKPPQDVPQDQLEQVRQQRIQVRDKLVQTIERILDEAERTDAELAKALAAADQNKIEPGKGGSLADAANTEGIQALVTSAGKPKDDSPKAAAEWWKSLSDEQRAALRENPPAWLGNRDGIPAEVRDGANRGRIDDERKALREQKATLERGGVSEDEQEQLQQVNDKLKSLDAVEKTIAKENPPRQLLVLDSSGERMKAAVAVGNVDTAEHVSVFTPGYTTTVQDGLGNYDSKMQELVKESEDELVRNGKSGDVAAVAWLGYEAPQESENLDVFGDSVASSNSAQEGGEKLNDFYKGINESRDTDPHLTAIGHSYGSTTTGYALQGGGHGVDDAIIFGSPGVGTNDIEDLHVPGGHAYRLEAKDDPVADFARFGGDPSHMGGFNDLSTEKSAEGEGVTGHSDYLNPGTTSQHNMASIVAGMPENTVEGKTNGVGDVISYVPHQAQEAGSAIYDAGEDAVSKAKDFGQEAGAKIKDLFS
ncbi:alpha/beta hydrolase [Saccharopolyspora sp. K220]|uniref:alpha/beta hydrolase n=1 Tax=Saccharopolyspora soli TaxID=2926618 RepID=UPI001F59718E|nr:alpha/beta hydrolase [Saccharopolyspora soli]MCI2417706.1 alpha/beta hydrolase [Saccharopolyspora soli]